MSNKTLIILWIAIITGSIFIFFNTNKAEPVIENPTKVEVNKETEVIDLSPKTYTGYINLGDRFLKQQEYQKAIDNFKQAASINTTSITPLNKLALAQLKNNQPKEAENSLIKAKEINSKDLETLTLLTQAYIDQRNFSAAQATIKPLDQNNPQIKYYSGILQILNQDFEKAKKTFKNLNTEQASRFNSAYENFALFTEGKTEHLQVLLAKALTEVDQHQAAIPLLFDVINKKNNYLDAWIILGYAYLNINQGPDAVDALTQAHDLNDQKPETLFFLGLAHFANSDIQKAIFYLEKADEAGFEPKEQIDLKLADLYLLQQEYKKSAKKFTEVLSKNTSSLDIFSKTIWLNIDKLNQPQTALDLASAALTSHPEEAMSYNLVGWALAANGDYEKSKAYLEKALQLKPNLDAAHLNLGWLHELQGQEAQAKEYYKQAYSLGNNNSIANLAAVRFNNIAEKEVKNYYEQVNISSP